jgi:hypothetical protein
MMALKTAAVACALLFLLLAADSQSQYALAGEGQDPTFSTPTSLDSSLMEPFQRYLSGPAWLMTEGLDPRITAIKGHPLGKLFPSQEVTVRGINTQAGGGGQGPLVPYRSPSPKFSRNILVTRDFSNAPFQTEPSLAVNPNDPEHIVLGVIDYNFPGITTYSTIDGGATWKGPSQVKYPADDLGGAGDPVIAFDRQGNAYAASISINVEEFTLGSAVGESAVSSIPIASSEDGGLTWSEPIASVKSHVGTSPPIVDETGRTTYELSLPFLDKPWLAVGPSKTDPYKDVIYVTYTKFVTIYPVFFLFDVEAFNLVPVTETSIEMVRSEDGGRTWSSPMTVSPIVQSSQGAESPKRVVQGSQPAVAHDGTLYVTWVDSTDDKAFKGLAEVYVARSDDGGRTFTTPAAASVFNEPGFSPRNALFRFWGTVFPQISVGPEGEVYVAYTAKPPDRKEDDGDIYLLASTDRGQTWSRKKLNDDDTNHVQFFPSISAGPDGVIHAMWGDMRDDPVEIRYHIYYTSSEDGGETWIENARVTDFPSNPNYAFPGGAFIGDYFTLKATGNDVYMAWPDARLGEYGPPNQKIAFARKELMPLPTIFLSPPSGPGGKDIAILGSNFQPDQNVFLEISGVVVSTVRSDAEGRFDARIFIPISGEGAHDFRAIDASGNVATGTFFMDFGFDNILGSFEDIAGQLDSIDQGLADSSSAQLQAIQLALEQLQLEKEPGGVDTWVVVVIAAAVALLSASLGLAVGIQMARRWSRQ